MWALFAIIGMISRNTSYADFSIFLLISTTPIKFYSIQMVCFFVLEPSTR